MNPTERQARLLWTSVTALALGILVALIGLLFWGLGWIANQLSSVLLPLAVAGVLAFILDPLVDVFENRTKSRIAAIWLVFALAILLVIALGSTVLPRLVTEIQSFGAQVPVYVMKVRDRLDAFITHPPQWLPSGLLGPIPAPVTPVGSTNEPAIGGGSEVSLGSAGTNSVSPAIHSSEPAVPEPAGSRRHINLSTELFSWTARVLPQLGSWMLDQVSRAASVAGFLAGLALVPVYLFYFLLEKRGIQGRWRDFLPLRESHLRDEVAFVLGSINDCLIVFFRGQVLVAFCVGAILTVGFAMIGLNYALLLGVLAGILGIVPYLGVAASLIPAVAIAIAQFGDWTHPLAVLGIFATAQLLEGFVISPKIIGDRVGLHPLTIIIAVMVGTTLLGGILGGVLAIPLTAVLRTIMFRYVWVARPKKELEAAQAG
jgi:predicted PurR-regulated permease PerM